MKATVLRRGRVPLSPINLTPLIDVLLVLVGVLLILAPHMVKRLPVELPRTTLNGVPALQRSLEIAIGANGALFMKGHSTSIKEITAHIDPGITTLQIAADKRVPYGVLANIVDALRGAQPRQIVLLTE